LNLFVDTGVWSLALRRDAPSAVPEVAILVGALNTGEPIYTTGLVLQELLQGFTGAKAREQIIERFAALPLLVPDRSDHTDASEMRNSCRRAGIQIGTIDALLAQLCVRHQLTMLTTNTDFRRLSKHAPLHVWQPPKPK